MRLGSAFDLDMDHGTGIAGSSKTRDPAEA